MKRGGWQLGYMRACDFVCACDNTRLCKCARPYRRLVYEIERFGGRAIAIRGGTWIGSIPADVPTQRWGSDMMWSEVVQILDVVVCRS